MTRSQAPARDDMDVKATFRHREGEAGQDLTRCRRIGVEETVDKYETLDAGPFIQIPIVGAWRGLDI
jgi:hypothetical protein